MEPQLSKLVFYSIGIVAVNKKLSSKEIEVTPSEQLFMLDGEITDNVEKWKTKSYEADNIKVYEEEIDATVTLRAMWLPCGSNRVTAPDVRRGEVVAIYRMADNDKYYWTSLLYDMRLRKLETVIYAISGTKVEADDGNSDNTYFFEWSTHNKMLHVHTSKADGEPFAYDIQLNTKDGNFTIKDDIGNYIFLDSKNARIELKNSDGSHVDMDRKNVIWTVPDNFTVKAGSSINLEAGSSVNIKASKTNHSGDGSYGGHLKVGKLTSQQNIDAPNV